MPAAAPALLDATRPAAEPAPRKRIEAPAERPGRPDRPDRPDSGFRDRLRGADASRSPEPVAEEAAAEAEQGDAEASGTAAATAASEEDAKPAAAAAEADTGEAEADEEAAAALHRLEEAFAFGFRTDLAPPATAPAAAVGAAATAALPAAGAAPMPGPAKTLNAANGPATAPAVPSGPRSATTPLRAESGTPEAAPGRRPNPVRSIADGEPAPGLKPSAASPAPTTEAPAPAAASATTGGAATPDRPSLAPITLQAPAAEAAATPAPEAAELNGARLGRGLRSAVSQGGGAVTLRLTPEALGTVRVQLDMSGGRVAAHFQAETSAARDLLQQQLPQLRASLEAQGLSVDRLSAGPAGSSAGSSSGGSQDAGSSRGQTGDANASANDGRSRGQHREQQPGDGQADRRGPDAGHPRRFADLFRS